jgi:hypothetical protein
MKRSNDAGLSRVLHALRIDSDALLGQGGESFVFSLDDERIARINRECTSQAHVDGRNGLLVELGRSAARVSFAIPEVLDTEVVEGHIVTIERRLPGRPLDQVLSELEGEARASLIHLDAFPGNMLADGEMVTAVIDFGASTIIGDRRLDPLTAAAYLDRSITPNANDGDRSVAQEWLITHDLAEYFGATQNWIAAYWSFAQNDPEVYQWCRSILLDKNHRGEGLDLAIQDYGHRNHCQP